MLPVTSFADHARLLRDRARAASLSGDKRRAGEIYREADRFEEAAYRGAAHCRIETEGSAP